MKGNINPEYVEAVRQQIGGWIKDMREGKGLTQEQLANKMGINQTTIAKIENGKWNFGIDTIILFAIHLDFYPFFIPKASKSDLAKTMRDRWKREQDEQ